MAKNIRKNFFNFEIKRGLSNTSINNSRISRQESSNFDNFPFNQKNDEILDDPDSEEKSWLACGFQDTSSKMDKPGKLKDEEGPESPVFPLGPPQKLRNYCSLDNGIEKSFKYFSNPDFFSKIDSCYFQPSDYLKPSVNSCGLELERIGLIYRQNLKISFWISHDSNSNFKFKKNCSFKIYDQFKMNNKMELDLLKYNFYTNIEAYNKSEDFGVNKLIKQFLCHLQIGSIENPRFLSDVVLFCLSKIFNFREILASRHFVEIKPADSTRSHRKLFTSKRAQIDKELKDFSSTDCTKLKSLLKRILAYLNCYSEFKKIVEHNSILKYLNQFALFNKKMSIKINPAHNRLTELELIRLINLDLLQDFHLFSARALSNERKKPIAVSFAMEHGKMGMKTIYIKAKDLCNLRFVHKKTRSILIKGVFKKIWKKFSVYCSIQNILKPSRSSILKKSGKSKSLELINMRNLKIIKKNEIFAKFVDSCNLNKMVENLVWPNGLNYLHLQKIKNGLLSPEHYLQLRFQEHFEYKGKRPWSLTELVTGLSIFHCC